MSNRTTYHQRRMKLAFATVIFFFLSRLIVPAHPVQAVVTRSIIFPVIGPVSFYDDFGALRAGHTHAGNDLLGVKMQPLVAAVDGEVRFVTWPQADYGYMVSIRDEDGYSYRYFHINNDHPGTDDGLGGGRFAYAPGMKSGNTVVKGQLIGWMGDSGNAESTAPHLHFEIHDPDGAAFSPYQSLIHATRIVKPAIAPPLPDELLPYAEFRGGANIAYGEIDGDPTSAELVTGAGPGGGPHVRIFRADNTVIGQFFAYDRFFRGGVDVAAGDVDGDGIDEIITGAGAGGKTEVKIFSRVGEQKGNFFAYLPSFKGSVRVAAADLDGDGLAEIITGPGAGSEPLVRVYSAAGKIITEFEAYTPRFLGGVDVAAMAATAANVATIVTGAGPGGGPDVRVFDSAGTFLANWYAYDRNFHGGVRVDAADVLDYSVNGPVTAPEIFTIPAGRGGAHIRGFTLSGGFVYSKFIFEPWWGGGYDIAAGPGVLRGASGQGGRRASVIDASPSRFFFQERRSEVFPAATPSVL